jgi:hypothetical protein
MEIINDLQKDSNEETLYFHQVKESSKVVIELEIDLLDYIAFF